MDDILNQLQRFQVSTLSHSGHALIDHLKGTCRILEHWGMADYLCKAGLCHSIYGTESFLRQPATLENRDYLRSVIGDPAERLAYFFGAHVKESLWENLSKSESFTVLDRFVRGKVSLSRQDLVDLITLTLANWLEQRPRAGAEHQFIRQAEFTASRSFLPRAAYDDFIAACALRTQAQGLSS